jgi:cellulose synthase/poly-beta-1,6-N-acetylglucosamine synthase-like glycosyltransferase
METFESTASVGLWLCLAVIAYVYAGYPATLLARRPRPLRPASTPVQPSVSVVIAAFNEASNIEPTVRDKLAQDYPSELLEVIVVSDNSSDGTDEIVRSIDDPRLRLLRQEPRQGKTAALNRAVAAATGEIIVFSDANSRYEPDTVRRLVSTFDDPKVGYVTGRLVYENPGETAVGAGSGMYIAYENWLRRLETRSGSIVGVNGGVDAVRRCLYSEMRSDHLPDFVLPLRVVQAGHRVVYNQDAVAHEAALPRHGDEFRMRVRVSLRALNALVGCRQLFLPRYGFFAFQLAAHKLLRYLAAIPLGGALLCNLALAARPAYALLLLTQLACYSLAVVGWTFRGTIRARVVFVPFYFCLINVAAVTAVIGFLRGHRPVVWTPRKGA